MNIELGHATDRKPPFKYAAFTRVGFSDTDAQGIVYYGRYLPYFDTARVEYHRHLGMLNARPEERAFLERVALLISPYCLVGWDTGGVPWSELS